MATRIAWHPDAEARIKRVPFFVRPLARRKAERAARERGLSEVTPELLEELRKAQHDS